MSRRKGGYFDVEVLNDYYHAPVLELDLRKSAMVVGTTRRENTKTG